MNVSDINAYGLVIGGSLVIILSYFANLLAKRTNIPSVLVLIGMGILIRQGLNAIGLTSIPFESLVLELLGTIGLIFIVLEAALELNLSREKMPLILKSATVALIALLGSSAAIAGFLHYAMNIPMYEGWVYGIPLSIMSSAIIIPSVSGLDDADREFMVYESTFSDIFGIMAFYLLLGNSETESANTVLLNIGTNLLVTFILAVVVSYILVYVLQKITSPVKLVFECCGAFAHLLHPKAPAPQSVGPDLNIWLDAQQSSHLFPAMELGQKEVECPAFSCEFAR